MALVITKIDEARLWNLAYDGISLIAEERDPA